MISILLLLLGAGVVQRRWRSIVGFGVLWTLVGLCIAADALNDKSLIPVHHLGWFLIFEGAMVLLGSIFSLAQRKRLRLAKGGGLLVVGLLTVKTPWHSDVLLAVLIGLTFAADGVFRVMAARVVRFPNWRRSLWAGIAEIVLAIITLEPLPTWYVGTIGANVGLLMMVSGWGLIQLGLSLRRYPPGVSISELLGGLSGVGSADAGAGEPGAQDLVVHVWTPVGTLSGERGQRRPLVDRYIAAVDKEGVVSTGHAALELAPDVYVSHYPAVEIDRSPSDFTRVLRATRENDVPGRFQPSYAEESAGWCEATAHVRFTQFDAGRLRAFWSAYRADTTYNLTHRNCSSAVAHALDAALEGVLGRQRHPLLALLTTVVTPELWAAALLRKRAEAMAWTPGLVLDYARALAVLVEGPAESRLGLLKRALQARRELARPAITPGRAGAADAGAKELNEARTPPV
jgi:uncharacterized membrane protein HdeD (DUF308 family)